MAAAHDHVDPDLAEAYLRRLGVEAEPPSVDALRRIHRAHVERVPYETAWIHMGDIWTTDRVASLRRIALESRGGYCYHLNGALSLLLAHLGYDVTLHVGGVHGPDGPDAAAMANHLVLTVAGLPTETNPSGRWYVDVGLGDALYEMLPLMPHEPRQHPHTFAFGRDETGVGDWHLTHDPAGGFVGMSFRDDPATMTDFDEQHVKLSTDPASGFVTIMTAQCRDATGIDVVRGRMLQRIGEGASAARRLERDDWFAALRDLFGLGFEHSSPADRDRLWERVSAAHAAWEAAQASTEETS